MGVEGSASVPAKFVIAIPLVTYDVDGNVALGGFEGGVGGATGANLDGDVYITRFPNASSLEVIREHGVNIGASAGEGLVGVGGELNFAHEQESGKTRLGGTLTLGPTAKANVPFLPIEFQGHWSYTFLGYEFNIFESLGLPKPEEKREE